MILIHKKIFKYLLAVSLFGILVAGLIFVFSRTKFLLIIRHYQYMHRTHKPIMLPIEASQISAPLYDTFEAARPNGRLHLGIDFFAHRGTPVRSASAGYIVARGTDPLGGNYIQILGLDNRLYYYAHLESFEKKLKLDDRAAQGMIIGYVGNSGNAMLTTSHLHFEIKEIDWVAPLITHYINPFFLF